MIPIADDASKVPSAVMFLRRTMGITLPLGVVGHEGSTIIVVTNGLRLLRSKNA